MWFDFSSPPPTQSPSTQLIYRTPAYVPVQKEGRRVAGLSPGNFEVDPGTITARMILEEVGKFLCTRRFEERRRYVGVRR